MIHVILGIVFIVIGVVIGVLMLFGIGMSDAEPKPRGWDLWSQLTPAHIVIVCGLAILTSGWWVKWW